MSKKALKKALRIVGGTSAMASDLGASQSRVSNWLKRGLPQKPEVILAIERATLQRGEMVPREELAPKMYPPRPEYRSEGLAP